ncbi:MAG: hypothetical protein LBJ62_00500 [Bifidobacteriaceae bacterium]|nr:hypothetical protein [Bifidobacteriaceae bacterium]
MVPATPSLIDGPSGLTAEASDDAVLAAIKLIRQAEGTVYAYDLIPVLWGSTPDDAPGITRYETQILATINRWGAELILPDTTRVTHRPGMSEYVTNIALRPVIDALVFEDASEFRIHPTAISAADQADGQVQLWRKMDPARLAELRELGPGQAEERLLAAKDRFLTVAGEPLNLNKPTDQRIADSVIWPEPGSPLVLNLSDCYFEDFDLARVLGLLGSRAVSCYEGGGLAIDACRAVFSGQRTSFSPPPGSKVTMPRAELEGAVFDSPEVCFDHLEFAAGAADRRRTQTSLLNLRDSTFTARVGRASFEQCKFTGGGLSLEDASVVGCQISFDNTQFVACHLFFYQLIAGEQSKFTFVGSRFEESVVDFSDSSVPSLLFYDVRDMPQCDFTFRRCGALAMENCSLGNPIKLASVRRLSLAGSHLSGVLLHIRDGSGGSRRSNRRARKNWFLDALEDGERSSLADELAAVKEVFHGMGEYELEDEAFIRHMRRVPRSKAMWLVVRLLDALGRFGTSPSRVAVCLALTVVLFFFVNAGLLALVPDGFVGLLGGSVWADSALLTWASFVQAGTIVEPISAWTIGVSLFQTTAGWFFLGYFFVAFTRKTLR